MPPPRLRLLFTTIGIGLALAAVLALLLATFSRDVRSEVRRTVIGRDATVLQPVARHQMASAETRAGAAPLRTEELLAAVLPSAQQEGMLAVAVFDDQGNLVRALPGTLLFAELATADYLTMLEGGPISRLHPDYSLGRHFAGAGTASAPVLEVMFPLHGRNPGRALGFAQYFMDARGLQSELALIEARLHRQALATLAAGIGLITLVLSAAFLGITRAQRLVAERNERLARTNFELTLATKASALGQITSHLIHGLQGSVSGLKASVSTDSPAGTDWPSVVRYTAKIESLVSEAIALLGEGRTGAVYELSGHELAGIIRERALATAASKGVRLIVENQLVASLDNHRGSVLCLIAANLIQNAIAATDPGRTVSARLSEQSRRVLLTVTDEGSGIDPALQTRLFEPGASNRPGGSGLGLAISRLLARQLNGDLELVASSPAGATFQAGIPRQH
jgi:signal transduction histidine kinase